MNQFPFIIKCPIESGHKNLSLRSISSPRQQRTFFTPPSSRFELKTPHSPALTYPYQSREIVTKCHNCSYKCCNQETGRWSMILKNHHERINDLTSKPVHVGQEQFSRHDIFQERHLTEITATTSTEEETAATTSTTTTTSGKRTRTAFTPIQLLVLETAFEKNHYVVGLERKQLAVYLKLTEQQVKVWYQNRRTKYKKNIQQNF